MASSAGAAAEGLFRCVYEGCIAGCDTGIERRPYHRNCGCALHNKSRKGGSNAAFSKCCKKNVSYPIRRSWSEGSLALHSSASSSSNHSSPACSSPPPPVRGAVAGKPHHLHQSSLCDYIHVDDDHQDEYVLFKI